MLDLHPTPTWAKASPVKSASLHDLVELHWNSICMSQAAQGSGSVSGITIGGWQAFPKGATPTYSVSYPFIS